jgi:hypothetical protein
MASPGTSGICTHVAASSLLNCTCIVPPCTTKTSVLCVQDNLTRGVIDPLPLDNALAIELSAVNDASAVGGVNGLGRSVLGVRSIAVSAPRLQSQTALAVSRRVRSIVHEFGSNARLTTSKIFADQPYRLSVTDTVSLGPKSYALRLHVSWQVSAWRDRSK